MSLSSPNNPYEPPREAAARPPDFADRDSDELADLRRRVSELERRVSRSWVVHPNFFLRVIGVFGYFLVGYAFLVGIVFVVMAVVRLLTGDWPS